MPKLNSKWLTRDVDTDTVTTKTVTVSEMPESNAGTRVLLNSQNQLIRTFSQKAKKTNISNIDVEIATALIEECNPVFFQELNTGNPDFFAGFITEDLPADSMAMHGEGDERVDVDDRAVIAYLTVCVKHLLQRSNSYNLQLTKVYARLKELEERKSVSKPIVNKKRYRARAKNRNITL